MGPGMKIAGAVVGGYVLGRRKKAKLAITMGALLAGKKLNLNPQRLLTDIGRELGSSEQFGELRDQVKQEVLGAGKTMATTMVTHQAERLTGSLNERTQSLQDASAGAEEAEQQDTARSSPRGGASKRPRSTTTKSTGGAAGKRAGSAAGKPARKGATSTERKPASGTAQKGSSSTARKPARR